MKSTADSRTTQTHLIRYQHMNGQGQLFGGMLLQWIDETAGIVALRHTGGAVITAAVDNLVFKFPAYLNDLIVLKGSITHIGRTSMEVRVDTYVESLDGTRTLINQAFLVMVSLDAGGKPAEIPPITLETEEEHAEWAMGEKRYALRKERRKQNY